MEIPLEIILYNIVNFTPSPLNNDVFLNLEVLFSQNNTLNRNSENNNELSEVIIYKNNKHGFSSAKNVLTFGDKENNNQNKPKKKEAKTLDNLNDFHYLMNDSKSMNNKNINNYENSFNI